MRQPHHFQQFCCPDFRILARNTGDHLRNDDILQRRELGQQVVILIDKTNPGTADGGTCVVAKTVTVLAEQTDIT